MVRRLLPLSGAVSVALFVVALPVLAGTNTPGTKDSAAKVTSFYLEHHTRQSVAAVLLSVAAGFLALFAASVWSAADVTSPWRRVFALGAVIEVTGLLAAATLHLALSEGVHESIAPGAIQALNALDNNDFLPFLIGVAVMMAGAAGAMIPLRGAERVLGWAALALAVASLTFTPAAFFAYLGSGVWILTASILLSRRAGTQTGLAPAAAQPVTA
jgi:hypothetical protein